MVVRARRGSDAKKRGEVGRGAACHEGVDGGGKPRGVAVFGVRALGAQGAEKDVREQGKCLCRGSHGR